MQVCTQNLIKISQLAGCNFTYHIEKFCFQQNSRQIFQNNICGPLQLRKKKYEMKNTCAHVAASVKKNGRFVSKKVDACLGRGEVEIGLGQNFMTC